MSGDFVAPGYMGFAASFVLMLGVLGVGWGSAILATLAHARRLARQQEHEDTLMHERARWQLLPGPARVVHGRVEVDGDSPALEIDVEQRVQNRSSKNSRWHEWREASRRFVGRAFRLVRDDGRTVHVQPHDGVLVLHALGTEYPEHRPNERVRSAIVRAGDEIYVYGDLVETGGGGGAYRGSSAFVLQAPRRGRMLVATEAMRDRYRDRIAYLKRAGTWMAVAFCAVHLLFTSMFLTAMIFGVRERATVLGARTYVTQGKHGPITHYAIAAETRDGTKIESDVGLDDYADAQRALSEARGPSITVLRVGKSSWASFLGPEPHVHFGGAVMGFIVALLGAIIAKANYEGKLAWYDRKRVTEYGGPGYWVEKRKPR